MLPIAVFALQKHLLPFVCARGTSVMGDNGTLHWHFHSQADTTAGAPTTNRPWQQVLHVIIWNCVFFTLDGTDFRLNGFCVSCLASWVWGLGWCMVIPPQGNQWFLLMHGFHSLQVQ